MKTAVTLRVGQPPVQPLRQGARHVMAGDELHPTRLDPPGQRMPAAAAAAEGEVTPGTIS